MNYRSFSIFIILNLPSLKQTPDFNSSFIAPSRIFKPSSANPEIYNNRLISKQFQSFCEWNFLLHYVFCLAFMHYKVLGLVDSCSNTLFWGAHRLSPIIFCLGRETGRAWALEPMGHAAGSTSLTTCVGHVGQAAVFPEPQSLCQ